MSDGHFQFVDMTMAASVAKDVFHDCDLCL